MKTNESFEKIANKLGTEYVETAVVSAIENEIEEVKEKKNELVKFSKNDITLEDKEYLNTEIKSLVKISKGVLEKLNKDIKIGTPPRVAEVFATLANSIVAQLKELRELNKMVMDTEILNVPVDPKPNASFNVKMTGSEMLELFEKMQKDSKLQKIDAEFKIEDEKKPKNKRKSKKVKEKK